MTHGYVEMSRVQQSRRLQLNRDQWRIQEGA